ncbi:MAG: Xaa-Pro peptidase family protein [Bacillota bacterium]
MQRRLNKLRSFLAEQQLDALLVSKPENRLYLSGFTGSAGLLYITGEQAILITDSRYVEQAGKQADHYEIVQQGTSFEETLKGIIVKTGSKHIGFESNHLTVQQYKKIAEPATDIEWQGQSLDGLRRIKDENELVVLRKAASIADAAFQHILSVIKPGVSEKDIALELDFFMRRSGAEKSAFDFIVASGTRSSLPHGVATGKLLRRGEMVTLDYGCVFENYCSDITRTLAVGTVDPQLTHIYGVVQQAQQAALQALRPGVEASAVDKIARDIIVSHGYGQYFGHGLGHGVGLAVHEEPRLAPVDHTILEPGMVVTVEPGIYLPGFGGVRIEDTVLITAGGCERLTVSSKDFIKI